MFMLQSIYDCMPQVSGEGAGERGGGRGCVPPNVGGGGGALPQYVLKLWLSLSQHPWTLGISLLRSSLGIIL